MQFHHCFDLRHIRRPHDLLTMPAVGQPRTVADLPEDVRTPRRPPLDPLLEDYYTIMWDR
jgi:hypothetical protein